MDCFVILPLWVFLLFMLIYFGMVHTRGRRPRVAAFRSFCRCEVNGRHVVSRVCRHELVDGACEFDSHADTCIVGVNFEGLETTNRLCSVSGFSDDYGTQIDVPIVTAATMVQDPDMGHEYILVIHEALHFPTLPHSLLCPNQIRHAGNDVWDNTFDPNRELQMAVYSEDYEPVAVPITVKGMILSFQTSSPTQHQLETLPQYYLTLDHVWDPVNVRLSCVGANEYRLQGGGYDPLACLCDVSSAFSPDLFISRMISQVIVHSHPADLPSARGFQSKGRHSVYTPEDLSNLWHIGLKTAKKTLAVTTHYGVCSAVLPLSQRYRTDKFFRKPQLHGRFYTSF
jgi:hypothetical protein